MDTELQLNNIFQECAGSDNRLNLDGLKHLCDRLELQSFFDSIADDLNLKLDQQPGVSYSKFRETLIKVLGPENQPVACESGGRSPAREVSPKYVFGKKKYGRRSRPDINEGENYLIDGVEACSVTEESLVKKRRTHCSPPSTAADGSGESEEEDMLVAAWTAVAPRDAILLQDELVSVFRGLGVGNGSEEAASTVFEKLDLVEGGITLDTLLAFIKSGATLSKDVKPQDYDSINNGDVTVGDTPTGFPSGSSILELWEAEGVTNGHEVLEQLGCRPGDACDLAQLTSSLHALLLTSRATSSIGLYRAGVILQRAYIHTLRCAVEQMSGEKEKLKADVSEANERSQLLAQEVDDHHARLEAATKRQVRALEQKHADRVRELTERVKAEQDQLLQQNQALESRLSRLEAEEAQSRSQYGRLEAEYQQSQDEHQALVTQLTLLQTERDELKRNVLELSMIQEKLHELEEMAKDKDVQALVERVSGLENENRNLKDKNDELVLQIEHLSLTLRTASLKRSSPERVLPELMDQLNDIDSCESLDVIMDKSAEGPVSSHSQKPAINSKMDGLSSSEMIKSREESVHSHGVDSAPSFQGAAAAPPPPCDCSSLRSSLDVLGADLMKARAEHSTVKSRCEELEKSMELLEEEYERTEDYWTGKLEEERRLFDAEQKQNDEKFSDLVNKIAEYEQLMKEEVTVRQRLETIEEKDQLEKQVLEIEEEYAKLVAEKDEEIERLLDKLNSQPSVVDAPVQTDLPSATTAIMDAGDVSGAGIGPCRRAAAAGERRRTCCKVYRMQGELRALLEAKQSAQREITALLAERNLLYNQVLNQRRADGCNASLNSKLLCAERRCRTLMASLRNQQLQTSELLRNVWQQHKQEVEELRGVLSLQEGTLHQQASQIQQQLSKLTGADSLVKDLFVENAYLLAALRKLEARQINV